MKTISNQTRRHVAHFRALLGFVIGLSGAVALAAGPVKLVVIQKGRAFDQPSVTVPVGGTISFTNQDTFFHHIFVDSPTFSFESDEQPPGQEINVTFKVAGTFDVSCRIHPRMHLSVVVQ